MSTLIQFRRDSAANWAAVNPVLAQGELGLELDTGNYKIGDGVTAWNTLTYNEFTGETNTLLLNVQPTDLSSAPAGHMRMYSKTIANRTFPKWVGPSGLDSAVQPLLARNKIGYWIPPGNATTVPGVFGYTTLTAYGSAIGRNVATANLFQRMRRLGYVSAATTASYAGARVAAAQVTVGDGTNLGGFFKVVRFGISDASVVAGARTFVGMTASTTAISGSVEPSTLTNAIGVGHGAADTNFKIYYGGSTAQTPIDLGADFPATTTNTDVYELALFAPPSSSTTVHYEVTRLNTGHVATGTLTGAAGIAIPSSSTLLTYNHIWRTNGATAAAVGIDIMSDYIETDN